jgi:hypothetical protein
MITNENYFSPENQMKYMGSSQFKSFMDCEARTMAEMKGEFVREVTKSMLVGSYVDAHFEGSLDVFQAKHPEIFTKSGELKAEFKQAEKIIERIERDDFFMSYMSGEKQIIKTGEIAGVPFKIKIDSYHPDKIVDLKIMKDMEPMWKEGQGKVNFALFWGYDIQAAIYQMIEGNNLPVYLAVATKESEPDIDVIQIPQYYIDAALEIVKANAIRFQAIKDGFIEPERCGHCDFCKATKVLNEARSLEEFDYAE